MTPPPVPRPERFPTRPRSRIAVVLAGSALALAAGLALTKQLPGWLVAPRYTGEVAGALVGAGIAWGAYRLTRRQHPGLRPPR